MAEFSDTVNNQPCKIDGCYEQQAFDNGLSMRNFGLIDSTSPFSNKWVEITEDFLAATSEGLGLGELLHDKMFDLFEAMSAIEMMDPKMDAGMMCNRGSGKILNFEQACKANKLKVENLTLEEHIGIIDATLACLVTWLEGHSLAQTLFTNLYLHSPDSIQDKVLRAFSLCVLKLVALVKDLVARAHVFEEEDFQSAVYGFSLAENLPETKAVGLMKEVEEEIHKKVKGTRPKPGEEQTPETQKEHEDQSALLARIKFFRLLYQAISGLARRARVEEAERQLTQCAELLPPMLASVELGVQPPAAAPSSRGPDYPTIPGFEPLVNQRLLPPTFPRYTRIRSRPEALNYLASLVSRLQHACKVLQASSFHSALDFFIQYSKDSPCVLSRSVLQLLYLPQIGKVFGSQPMAEVLKESIRQFIRPSIFQPKTPQLPQVWEATEVFLAHCVRPFSNLLQTYGHNHARQRDKLAALLDELATLQDQADKLDTLLYKMSQTEGGPQLACFGTWVLYHILRVMVHYVLSGFELELYAPHEFTYIYWYLYEFLFGWLITALTRADSYLLEQEAKAEQAAHKSKNAKKNKKKKKPRAHRKEIIFTQALQNICGGLYKAVVGLKKDGRLPQPSSGEFDQERVRYEHRFAPLGAVLTPPPVHYSQFREALAHSPAPFLDACKCFHNAKLLLESLPDPSPEIQALIKVAKTNFVVVKLVLGGHLKDTTVPPQFDFSQHYWFPIIKIR